MLSNLPLKGSQTVIERLLKYIEAFDILCFSMRVFLLSYNDNSITLCVVHKCRVIDFHCGMKFFRERVGEICDSDTIVGVPWEKFYDRSSSCSDFITRARKKGLLVYNSD